MSTLLNELRIGNLIFDSELNEYFEVEQISKYIGSELWVIYRNGSIKTKNPEPIPLTEKWLLKFGFVENKKWFYKEKFILGYLSTDENLQAEYKFGGVEGSWNLINIKYVHQLQNIYFALTNEELTIKP